MFLLVLMCHSCQLSQPHSLVENTLYHSNMLNKETKRTTEFCVETTVVYIITVHVSYVNLCSPFPLNIKYVSKYSWFDQEISCNEFIALEICAVQVYSLFNVSYVCSHKMLIRLVHFIVVVPIIFEFNYKNQVFRISQR